MIQLTVLKDSSEIVHYRNPNVPIYVEIGILSSFPKMTALCHWHDDIEYIKVTKGHMMYSVNDKKILLKENDGLLVNSKQMHFGFTDDRTECEFICILFSPNLLKNNVELTGKFLDPVISASNVIEYYYLNSQHPSSAYIIELYDMIFEIYQNKKLGFEFDIVGKLFTIWIEWFKLINSSLSDAETNTSGEVNLQKQMVTYIHQNYSKRITLNDIAQSGNVCKSKCCKIFKKYLNKSPMGFLNSYRMIISIDLLKDSQFSITEIAYTCGFSNPSYYSEMFKQYKGCTPSEFRQYR